MGKTTLILMPLILVTLASLSGCGNDLYPPTGGDFVTTSSGYGTAQAWGIDFEIKNTGGGGAMVGAFGGRSIDPEKTDARKEITLGQYAIVLEKVPGSPITMTINEQEYGTVEIGDSIKIASVVVRVNGVIREPEVEEPAGDGGGETDSDGSDGVDGNEAVSESAPDTTSGSPD
jgi:hypothetical protein